MAGGILAGCRSCGPCPPLKPSLGGSALPYEQLSISQTIALDVMVRCFLTYLLSQFLAGGILMASLWCNVYREL